MLFRWPAAVRICAILTNQHGAVLMVMPAKAACDSGGINAQ
jgi:hypothetical protein